MEFRDPVQGDKLLGAFRAACGINGVTILIHAPVGCHWGVNYIERLSSVKTSATISALRERNVIFGGEENLKKTIEIMMKNKKNGYLILLAGSIPSIIGEDWQGVVDSMGSNYHSICLDCGGYLGAMGKGYEECLTEIHRWIDIPAQNKVSERPMVNLIGLQRDIIRSEANIQEIKRILSLIGIKVNSVFPPLSLAELKRGGNADLNVVLGYGKELAEKMKINFGIPWISCQEYPYGFVGTDKFVKAVGNGLGLDADQVDRKLVQEKARILKILKQAHFYFPSLYGIPVAISADLPNASGMARFLSMEIGVNIEGIHVTSSPDSSDGFSQLEDICPEIFVEDSWSKFETLLENKEIKVIFGTDLENEISKKMDIPLIVFSYPTISRVALTATPYMGFRGVLTMMEELVNFALN